MDRYTQVRQQIRNYRTRHLRTPVAVRGSRSPYYRRGVLGVPAILVGPDGHFDKAARDATQRHIEAAVEVPVDCLFFDLDTAVPRNDDLKAYARRQVISAFRDADFGNRVRAVRCSPMRSPWFEEDLIHVVGGIGDQLDALIIPGCETADEVRDVQTILRNLQHAAGRRNRVFIEVLVDSPRAFAELEAIAALEDVASLVFSARFARAIGASLASPTWRHDLAAVREHLPAIAAAYGKVAVDGVTRALPADPDARAQALETIAAESRTAAAQGFSARWIGHADAVDAVQDAWTPSPERAQIALDLAVRYVNSRLRPGSVPPLDHAMVVADWWVVRAAQSAGILTDAEFRKAGHALPALERAVHHTD